MPQITGGSANGYFGCGAAILSGVGYGGYDIPKWVKKLLTQKQQWAFYVMADAKHKNPQDTQCQKFQAYIEKHDLGPIIESDGWHLNEAHGPNYIKIYVWRPDWDGDGVKKWLKANEGLKVEVSMW